jgi:uncharacterized phage infection (PIP) family protein YhgE
MADTSVNQSPNSEPEWKTLISQLANLNNKGGDIKNVAINAAETIQRQSQALQTVSDALEKILNNINKNPSTIEIKEALEKANGDQVEAINSLIKDQNDALTAQLNTLDAKVKQVSDKTNAITNAQNPQPEPGSAPGPSVGGKRRRRTRNKRKKHYKKTKKAKNKRV